jgi:hypothetical protein
MLAWTSQTVPCTFGISSSDGKPGVRGSGGEVGTMQENMGPTIDSTFNTSAAPRKSQNAKLSHSKLRAPNQRKQLFSSKGSLLGVSSVFGSNFEIPSCANGAQTVRFDIPQPLTIDKHRKRPAEVSVFDEFSGECYDAQPLPPLTRPRARATAVFPVQHSSMCSGSGNLSSSSAETHAREVSVPETTLQQSSHVCGEHPALSQHEGIVSLAQIPGGSSVLAWPRASPQIAKRADDLPSSAPQLHAFSTEEIASITKSLLGEDSDVDGGENKENEPPSAAQFSQRKDHDRLPESHQHQEDMVFRLQRREQQLPDIELSHMRTQRAALEEMQTDDNRSWLHAASASLRSALREIEFATEETPHSDVESDPGDVEPHLWSECLAEKLEERVRQNFGGRYDFEIYEDP